MSRRPSSAAVWAIILGLIAAGALGALGYTWKQSFGLNESYLSAQSDAALLRQNLQSASEREKTGVEKLAVVQAELDATKKRLNEAEIVLVQMQSNQAAAAPAASTPAPPATAAVSDGPETAATTSASLQDPATTTTNAPGGDATTASAASTNTIPAAETNTPGTAAPPPPLQIQGEPLRPEAAP